MRLPLGGGIVFRTSGTWPRTKALYCYPAPAQEWPADPDIVERVGLRSCVRRGAAIDLVLDRGRENRSQLVFTTARGRDAVFWQSPRTRKQARPNVGVPTARAAGSRTGDRGRQPRALPLPVRRPAGHHQPGAARRRLRRHPRRTARRLGGTQVPGRPGGQPDQRQAPLRPGRDGRAASRRGRGRGPLLGDLQADRVRPALVADGLAEVQVRCPNVPIVFCETRQLAQEWTYRFLAAARSGAETEEAAIGRIMPAAGSPPPGSPASTRPPPPPGRRPPRSAPGRAPRAFPFRTAAGSAPRSGTPGAPRPPRIVNERDDERVYGMSSQIRTLMGSGFGLLRHEPTAKRIRAELGGETVVDSTRAVLVWEPRRVVPSYACPPRRRGELVPAGPAAAAGPRRGRRAGRRDGAAGARPEGPVHRA